MSAGTPHYEAQDSPKKLEGGVAKFNPRQLSVVWGKDERYWKIPSSGDGHAELLQVCWLEVSGCVSLSSLSQGDKYKISFTASLKSDAFGWNNCPVYVMAKFGKKGKYTWKKTPLSSSNTEPFNIPNEAALEIEVKDKDQNAEPMIYFGLYEVWSGKWKGGLLLHSAKVEKVSRT